jgi:hypothetical protein
MLSPNDHARMLVELLRPGGVELARRWVAALLLAPPGEREGVVAAVEEQMARLYTEAGERAAEGADARADELRVAYPPQQRDGFVEQAFTTYDVTPASASTPARTRAAKSPAKKAGRSRRA